MMASNGAVRSIGLVVYIPVARWAGIPPRWQIRVSSLSPSLGESVTKSTLRIMHRERKKEALSADSCGSQAEKMRVLRGMAEKAQFSAPHADARRVAKILRAGNYSYDQSKHLIAEARRIVGLTPPKRAKGSVARFNSTEIKTLLSKAYASSGTHGLMIRALLETGSRVTAFTKIRVEDIAWDEQEIRIRDKGGKARDVPKLGDLAQQLRIHLSGRESGFLFPSPRGGAYSVRRIQQLVKAIAKSAGIKKNVYPHLLRKDCL